MLRPNVRRLRSAAFALLATMTLASTAQAGPFDGDPFSTRGDWGRAASGSGFSYMRSWSTSAGYYGDSAIISSHPVMNGFGVEYRSSGLYGSGYNAGSSRSFGTTTIYRDSWGRERSRTVRFPAHVETRILRVR